MTSHEFSTREKILIFVFTLLLLATFYYKVAYVDFKQQMAQYDVVTLQEEMDIEQAKGIHMTKMKTAIEQSKSQKKGEVEKYNNQANEMIAINNALGTTSKNVSISWGEPILESTIVRRSANVSFTTSSYESFKAILKDIAEGPYRCIVNNVQISTDKSESVTQGAKVNVSLQIVYYETIDGVKDLSGLDLNVDYDDEPGVLETRAHALE